MYFQEIERIFSEEEDVEPVETFHLNDLNCPNSSTTQVQLNKNDQTQFLFVLHCTGYSIVCKNKKLYDFSCPLQNFS